MTITMGKTAPFSRVPGSDLNLALPASPRHVLFHHSLEGRRLRGEVGGQVVLETTGAWMLHETGLLPRWYVPRDAVPAGMLEPSDTTTHCPFKGDASYWHLRVGDRLIEDALWEYAEPLPAASWLQGALSPYFEKFDRWLEEDDEVVGHPRDPFHRVDARRSSRHVVVRVGGEVVAESDEPVAVFETGLPTRWYLPAASVPDGALSASELTTVCAYKGTATYRTVSGGGVTVADGMWTYEQPLLEAVPLAGHVSFLGEGIEVEVDGEPQE